MGSASEPRRHRVSKRRPRLGGALLLTAASTVVPGTAHLSRRRWIPGSVLLASFLVVVGAVVLVATRDRAELLKRALDTTWLLTILIGTVAVALLWCASVVWSYLTVRPPNLSRGGKVVAGVTVTALCALVCAPLGLAANYAQATRGLVTDVFPDAEVSGGSDGGGSDTDPWAAGERLNVLLLGGDAHPSRPGVRTDVMMVASIDPDTGRTVLFSVPRNLENAPMPFPALRQRFPDGFPRFLFGVWRYGTSHPQLVPGSKEPGAHLLTETIQRILGIPVDYYALVDLDGFKQLVNALGGVWIDVQQPIPYGEQLQFRVDAGYRPLTGREALWYARSRAASSDYDRMRRQRCLIGALAKQANPMTVLRNFRQLADATKRTVSTSVPRDLLPELLDLAPKVRNAKISNVQLVPPLIDTGEPNYNKIRRVVQQTLAKAEPPPDSSKGGGSETPGGTRQGPGGDTGPSPTYVPPDGGNQRAQGGRDGPRQRQQDQEPQQGRQGQRGQPAPGERRPGNGQGSPTKPGQRNSTSQEGAGQSKPVSLQAACPRTGAPE